MHFSPSHNHAAPPFSQRLDRVFADLNAVLVALAIGLAVLDFTCFVGLASFAEITRAEQNALLATQAEPHAHITADAAFR